MPRVIVEAPPVESRPFGLLSAAQIINDLEGNKAQGIAYQPEVCGQVYDTGGVCAAVDFGTLTASVNASRSVTLAAAGAPTGAYTIEWGNGTSSTTGHPNGANRTYTEDGTYVVTVTSSDGYLGVVTVLVTNGVASGPYDAVVDFGYVGDNSGIPLVDGAPFLVYGWSTCRPVGDIDHEERARKNLLLGEPRVVERVLGAGMAADPAAVDLTVAGAVSAVDGLALLEKHLGANYGGIGVVHSPLDVATILGTRSAIERMRGSVPQLETTLGTRFAAGGGYDGLTGPGGTAAGAGEAWLWATGQAVIHRSPEPRIFADMMRRTPATNDVHTMAQRDYTATYECVAAAVLVSTSEVAV